jgi:hypothetical protein
VVNRKYGVSTKTSLNNYPFSGSSVVVECFSESVFRSLVNGRGGIFSDLFSLFRETSLLVAFRQFPVCYFLIFISGRTGVFATSITCNMLSGVEALECEGESLECESESLERTISVWERETEYR